MFGKEGPTLLELLHQALCSTERGYDLLAPKFDATPFRTPDEILTPTIDAIGPMDAALDLCCGTGAAMRLLKPNCRTRLTGVDFSQGMLAQAERRLWDAPGEVRPELIHGDIFDLRYSAEFDVVTCFGALGHVPPSQERAFLRIVRQALNSGGRFVFVSGNQPSVLSVAGIALRTFNGVMHIRNALLKPPFIMYYLTFVLPEVETLLSEEGFRVEICTGLFSSPFERYKLVIATKS